MLCYIQIFKPIYCANFSGKVVNQQNHEYEGKIPSEFTKNHYQQGSTRFNNDGVK